MKKGFTLIELLAVLVVLAIILTIITISTSKILSNSEKSLSDTQKKNIEDAAEAYYIKEGMNNNVSCVDIQTLISGGYLDANKVIDPKTEEEMQGSVTITYSSNHYSYKYQDNSCE